MRFGSGGHDGDIYYYNGKRWRHVYRHEKEGYTIRNSTDIWGSSGSDFFAIGLASRDSFKSYLLHYDGDEWKELFFSEPDVQFHWIRGYQNELLISGTKTNHTVPAPDTLAIYRYSDGKMEPFLTQALDQGELGVGHVGSRFIINRSQQLYNYVDGELIPVLTVDKPIHTINVFGRSLNDLFINAREGLFHFNGEDIEALFHVPADIPRRVYSYQLFEDQIFLVIEDFQNGVNLVYHGTLN